MSDEALAPEYRAYAVIGPDGSLVADSTFPDAESAWRIVLGWPTRDEIEAAKAKGYRAVYGRFIPD
jgi:hypothetical protein